MPIEKQVLNHQDAKLAKMHQESPNLILVFLVHLGELGILVSWWLRISHDLQSLAT
jgi:hypothetical protein